MGWQTILDERQKLSAVLTVAGLSVPEIAEKTGVTDDTVRGWHRSPAWQQARDHIAAEADGILRADTREAARAAIDYCVEILGEDSKATPAAKLRASSIILQHERSYHAQQLELTGARGGPIQTEGIVPTATDALSAAEKLRARLGISQPAQITVQAEE